MRAPLLYCQRAFNWQLLNNRKANDSIIQLSPEIKSLLLSNGASVFIIYWKRLTHPCSVMICPMPTSYKSCQWFTNLGQFMVLICYYKYKTQLMHLSLEQTITRFIYYNAQITASKPFEMTIIFDLRIGRFHNAADTDSKIPNTFWFLIHTGIKKTI